MKQQTSLETNLAEKQHEFKHSVDFVDGLKGHRFLQRQMDTIHTKTSLATRW